MSKLSVYLAGGISEVSTEESKRWRDDFITKYGDRLEIFNPLSRDKDYVDLSGSSLYEAIANDERKDILNSDATIAYIGPTSMGTAMGIMYAYLSGRTVVIVRDPPDRKLSKMVKHHTHKICTSFDDAVNFIEARHNRNIIKKVIKRDGTLTPWNPEKIHKAIQSAVEATSKSHSRTHKFDPPRVEKLVSAVVMQIMDNLEQEELSFDTLSIEDIQDMVEKVLMDNAHRSEVHTFAKEYIIYRRKHKEKREKKLSDDEAHEFIMDTIHDFKSPVGNLRRNLDYLEIAFNENNTEEIKDNLTTANEIQEDMLRLIHQRKKESSERYQKINVNVRTFVQDLIKSTPPEGVKFHNKIPQDFWVDAPLYKLNTIFKNLIDNSIAHGFKEKDGDIYIDAKTKNENNLLIEYWNSGSEISRKDSMDIFSEKTMPSSNVNNFRHGMKQVNRYVEELGGTIDCIPLPEGKKIEDYQKEQFKSGQPRFIITLPLSKEQKQKKRTILVADDNPIDRKMMTKILSHADFDVLTAGTPNEALELAKENDICGAVIDMDFNDEHDGVWLIKELEKINFNANSN
jgi:signal transduction histidine kinase